MSLHFLVKFGKDVSVDQLYSRGSQEELDSEFEERVVEELDEELDVVSCRSAVESDAYVVFRAEFDRSDRDLYETFGNSGMADIIEEVAEEVYGVSANRSTMERWWLKNKITI